MAIRGTLSEASLEDVLQLLAVGQKTGCLSIAGESAFGTMHFDRGRLVYAGVVNRRDTLSERLIRAGVATADALAMVRESAAIQDDRDLAEAILAAGVAERESVAPIYRAQVEDAVYHLVTWKRGTFTFEADSQPSGRDALISVSIDSLLLEGARRVDEWTLIAKRIPSLDLIFGVDAQRIASRESQLSEAQEKLLRLLDGVQDVNTVIERSGLGEFEAAKELYGLIAAGFANRVGRSAARRLPSAESRVAEHRNLGIAFYRTGMYDEASREFKRVLELRDEDSSARFHLGLVHLRRSEWTDAVEVLRRASTQPDAIAAVFHNLAFAFEQLDSFDEAEAALREAMRRGAANDPRSTLSMAMLALKRGTPTVALEHLVTARGMWGARQPSAAWFHASGLVSALLGDLAGAITTLEEGIGLHPHAVVLHNNLAVVQERHGSYEQAARTLEHALLEDASLAHLHKNLGDYLYRAGRYDEAFESFTRVVRLDAVHGADVFLKLGNIHYRRGAMNLARASWQQALARDPRNRIVRANLEALGRHEETAPGGSSAVRDPNDAASPRTFGCLNDDSSLSRVA